VAHLRQGISHEAIAVAFGVDRSTITRAIGQIRPLLANRGFATPGGVRLRTLADVFAYAAAEGIQLRIDGTEIRVRRPRAGRAGRKAFVSGKLKQNTVKTTLAADEHRATLWCGATRPGRMHGADWDPAVIIDTRSGANGGDGAFGNLLSGGYAEYAPLPVGLAEDKPAGVSFVVAVTRVRQLALLAGATLLVTGIGGSVWAWHGSPGTPGSTSWTPRMRVRRTSSMGVRIATAQRQTVVMVVEVDRPSPASPSAPVHALPPLRGAESHPAPPVAGGSGTSSSMCGRSTPSGPAPRSAAPLAARPDHAVRRGWCPDPRVAPARYRNDLFAVYPLWVAT
jgi:hypothetical protein